MSHDEPRLNSANAAWPVVQTLAVCPVVRGNAPTWFSGSFRRDASNTRSNSRLSCCRIDPVWDSAYTQIAVVAQLTVDWSTYCDRKPSPGIKDSLRRKFRVATRSIPVWRLMIAGGVDARDLRKKATLAEQYTPPSSLSGHATGAARFNFEMSSRGRPDEPVFARSGDVIPEARVATRHQLGRRCDPQVRVAAAIDSVLS